MKRAIRLLIAVPLLYGLLPVAAAWLSAPRWDGYSRLILAFIVLFALGGIFMLSSLLLLLVRTGQSQTAMWTGGIASLVTGAIFAFFTLTEMLPCSGPD